MIKLSPSTLGDFNKCQRCFWFDKKMGKPKPRGIFPSLPGGMDKAIKARFDAYRLNRLMPVEIKNKVSGELFPDQRRIDSWRAWGMGLDAIIGGTRLSGQIDDAIQEPDGSITVLDYKTRGYPPKPGDSELYYGQQMDAYGLLFQMNGRKISGKGHLVYYWPARSDSDLIPTDVKFVFESTVVDLDIRPERTLELINRIVAALAQDVPPVPALDCEYCAFVSTRTRGC